MGAGASNAAQLSRAFRKKTNRSPVLRDAFHNIAQRRRTVLKGRSTYPRA
jgi:hypothetical protein